MKDKIKNWMKFINKILKMGLTITYEYYLKF